MSLQQQLLRAFASFDLGLMDDLGGYFVQMVAKVQFGLRV